jgi:hypothetical protein
MEFIKKLIGGQEEPIEQRRETNGMAEQSIPVAESYQPAINNNKNTSSSRKSNKKTRKMATIVRPRTINVQKIPKSLKKRITNLENTVTNYGNKANKYIDNNKQQVAVLENKVDNYENKMMNEKNNVTEEIVYVPIVFRTWATYSGQGQPIEFVRNTATEISLHRNNYYYEQGSTRPYFYDFDIISQLKNLKTLTIIDSMYGSAQFIINGQTLNKNRPSLTELKTILENTYPGFKNINIKINIIN